MTTRYSPTIKRIGDRIFTNQTVGGHDQSEIAELVVDWLAAKAKRDWVRGVLSDDEARAVDKFLTLVLVK